jgi:hypothetical protein
VLCADLARTLYERSVTMTLFGPATRDLRRGGLGERRGGSLCSLCQRPRILPSKIKPGLTRFWSARARTCADFAHVQIWHTFDQRPASTSQDLSIIASTRRVKLGHPQSSFRTRPRALRLRIEVSKPLPQSLKLTRFKVPLFFCAHAQRSATASANFVPTGVRV